MMYHTAELLISRAVGTDALGNEITQYEALCMCTRAWFAPWTAQEVQSFGREVTRVQRRLMLPCVEREYAQKAEHVRVDNAVYDIVDRAQTPRWLALTVRRCGSCDCG